MKETKRRLPGCQAAKQLAATAVFLWVFLFFCFPVQAQSLASRTAAQSYASEGDYWIYEPMEGYPSAIAHGGGFIEGYTVTNSLEAVLQSIERGFTLIELDMSFTTDGKIAMIHDWESSPVYYLGAERNAPISYRQYTESRILEQFQVLTMDSLQDILQKHPKVRIVTDTKEDNLRLLEQIQAEYPLVAKRIIPQIYDYDQYEPVREMGYKDVILTLYKISSQIDPQALCDFAKEKDLYGVTMSYALVDQGLASRLQDQGVAVYMHTVNSLEEYGHARENGARGIYTDDLLPEEIETAQSRYYLIKTQGPGEGQRMDFQLMSSPFSLHMKGPENSGEQVAYYIDGRLAGRGPVNQTLRLETEDLAQGVYQIKAQILDDRQTVLAEREYSFRLDDGGCLLFGKQYDYILEDVPFVADYQQRRSGFSDRVREVLDQALIARAGSPVYYNKGQAGLFVNGSSLCVPVTDEEGNVLIPLYDSAISMGAVDVWMDEAKAMIIQMPGGIYTAAVEGVSLWVDDRNTTVLKGDLAIVRNKAMAGGNLLRGIFGRNYLQNDQVLVVLPPGTSLTENIQKSVLDAAERLYQSI